MEVPKRTHRYGIDQSQTCQRKDARCYDQSPGLQYYLLSEISEEGYSSPYWNSFVDCMTGNNVISMSEANDNEAYVNWILVTFDFFEPNSLANELLKLLRTICRSKRIRAWTALEFQICWAEHYLKWSGGRIIINCGFGYPRQTTNPLISTASQRINYIPDESKASIPIN